MEIPYPQPDARIGNRRFWKKGTHRDWLAKVTGQPNREPLSDDDEFMTAADVKKALGGVSAMWLHRHMKRQAEPMAAA